MLANPNIEVKLNTELTARLAKEENADVIMCAVGALPIVPPIPGLQESDKVVGLDELRYAAPRFMRIGDCIKAGKVHAAVTGGYYGAIDI